MSHSVIAALLRPLAKEAGYTLQAVSWEDCTRGYAGGELACWGSNITDVRVVDDAKGTIFMVRSENFNERIAYAKASEIAVVVGNEEPSLTKSLRSVLLSDYLKRVGAFAKHAGAPADCSLLEERLDGVVSIRPQVAFVKAGTQFTTNAFVYGSRDPTNPQNLLLYCTAQGTSPFVPAGMQGENLYLQAVRPDGTTELSWLKAKASEFGVGAEQKETAETRASALAAGSAVAMCIGPKALGPKFNVCMTVQLPLKQREVARYRGISKGGGGGGGGYLPLGGGGGGGGFSFGEAYEGSSGSDVALLAMGGGGSFGSGGGYNPAACAMRGLVEQREPIGKSTAARVSKGDVATTDWKGLHANQNWTRHPTQHATVTVTFYFAVEGGVPSAPDVRRAIAELDQFFEKLGTGGRRADTLTVNDPKSADWIGPPGLPFQFTVPEDPTFPVAMDTSRP